MRVEDEGVTFDVFKVMDFPSKVHSYILKDDLDPMVAQPYRA